MLAPNANLHYTGAELNDSLLAIRVVLKVLQASLLCEVMHLSTSLTDRWEGAKVRDCLLDRDTLHADIHGCWRWSWYEDKMSAGPAGTERNLKVN